MRLGLSLIAIAVLSGAVGKESWPAWVAEPLPHAGVCREVTQSDPVRFELDNGLRVWVQEDRRRPVTVVEISYEVGSLKEGPSTTGLAHYVEHMVYRATENIPSEDGYRFIDRIGGRWSGATGAMRTMYREIVPDWALEDALFLTAERMARSLFDETEFERERSNVLTEAYGFSRTTPQAAFRDALMATSFEVHPYRNSSNTWARDNMTVRRDEAYDFYRHYYGPNSAVLTVVGNVSVDEVRRLVQKHFGGLAPAPRTGEVTLVEPPQRVEKRLTLTHPDVEKRVEILYRSPHAPHRDYPVLVVLDRVLSVRLQSAVRTLGGGEVSTRHEARPYPFVYGVSVTVIDEADPEGLVEAIQEEIERLGREGVPEGELHAARTAAVGHRALDACRDADQPPSFQEIVDELMAREVSPWEVGPELVESIRRAELSVTSEQIQAYVDRWLRTSQRTVGFLLPGTDDFVPDWPDDRPLVGERVEVPALSVPPQARGQPQPVPARALEPLSEFPIETGRREAANGVLLQAARRDGTMGALHARIRFFGTPDPPGKEGLSLLTARLLASDPSLAVSEVGFEVETSNATSIANHGHFDIRLCFPAPDTRTAVEALARALEVSSFPEERLEAERRRLLEEVRGGAGGEPLTVTARRRVLEVVAPSWRLSAPGTPESLARITAADVNEYLARHIHGGTLSVSLVGPHPAPALLEVASSAFGNLRPGEDVGLAAGWTPTSEHPTTPASFEEELIPLEGAIQVDIVAGLPGVPRDHPDWLPLQFLNYIVGLPSYGGRLGWALTINGLTYSSSATTTSGTDTGFVLLSTRANTNNAGAAIQAIREIVTQVGDDGVADWEIMEAKAFTLGRTILHGPRDDSDAATLASALLDAEHFGEELLDLPLFSQAVLEVTPEEVNAAARRYYRPERLKLVAIGALLPGPIESQFAPGTFKALFEEQSSSLLGQSDGGRGG